MTEKSPSYLSMSQMVTNLQNITRMNRIFMTKDPSVEAVAPEAPVTPSVPAPQPLPEVFVDPGCTVCHGVGSVRGNRCVLCDAQGEIVRSME